MNQEQLCAKIILERLAKKHKTSANKLYYHYRKSHKNWSPFFIKKVLDELEQVGTIKKTLARLTKYDEKHMIAPSGQKVILRKKILIDPLDRNYCFDPIELAQHSELKKQLINSGNIQYQTFVVSGSD
jgi:hypothetical protein